ncbi:hypothetical protein THAOC_20748 [Thalassiosira oceanica]|uniref:Uncharacterized protein n=1 Tax=Thalassiosira oceanica TaxID=159749 RepID=K0S1C8_THAOC|nr:hypothetical protein THAOC_20748 [Thalassiosira oceanica]|eukprot:EJK59080.1 hypothetical protein THAOC_20748 [Thalassiosira oceanica]
MASSRASKRPTTTRSAAVTPTAARSDPRTPRAARSSPASRTSAARRRAPTRPLPSSTSRARSPTTTGGVARRRPAGRRGRQRAARSGPVPVKRMHFVDAFGDSGLYTGEVDDDNRPPRERGHEVRQRDLLRGETRDRIMGGFTSWKSSRSNRSNSRSRGGRSDNDCFVYGMDWVDVMGRPGKYTGEVSPEDEPNGKGVMRYEMGLVAEGEWIKGVLNDGSGITRANAAATVAGAGMSVAPGGGMTVAPGGMSVVAGGAAGSGAATVVSGLGMMSIGGSNLMAHPAMMGMGQPMQQQFHRQQSYPHQMQQQPHPAAAQAVGQGVPMFCAPPHNGQQQF